MRLVVAAPLDSRRQDEYDALLKSCAAGYEAEGHDVEAVALPQPPSARDVMDFALAMRLFDLGSHTSALITLGGYTHLLTHQTKIAVVPEIDPILSIVAENRRDHGNKYLLYAFRQALSESRRVVSATADVATLLRSSLGVNATEQANFRSCASLMDGI